MKEIAGRVPTGTKSHTRRIDREQALSEMGLALPESIEVAWWERAVQQVGTLGSGNHFLEVQRDGDDRVFVMLHSGSRSLGKSICDAFHKRALTENTARGDPLPHRALAHFRDGSGGFGEHWSAMTFALRFAEVNRSRMLDQVEIALGKHTPIGRFVRVVDIHHNDAVRERHFGQDGIVHRKGAVRARVAEKVLIPGSMGTASYAGEGLGNREAFETCQHGAGRQMSRSAARKTMTSAALFAEMGRLGVILNSGDPGTAAEEAPFAYKDIESVMAASADLVRPTMRLTPLGVVKG